MSKRILRTQDKTIGRVRKAKPAAVTRAEFDAVIALLNERGKIITELRRDVESTCRHLAEKLERELQTQFRRIAQLQQEIDKLKKQQT